MTRVISITNRKGGVGKTVTAVNLSAYLAAMGRYVLLIDFDPQANATIGLGIDPQNLEGSIYHVIARQKFPDEILKTTHLFSYEVLPSSGDLAGATVELVNQKNRETKLKEIIDKIKFGYHYILIDCPPSLDILTLNCLMAADEVIIPIQCEYYALRGLDQLLDTINLVGQNLNHQLKIMGALLTLHDPRNNLSKEVVKEVREKFPGRVFNTIIPRCVSLAEAPKYGKTILEYAPNSQGAKAYRQLAEEIIALEKL